MSILSITQTSPTGQIDTPIGQYQMNTTDTLSTVTTAGYINNEPASGISYLNTPAIMLANTSDYGVVNLNVSVSSSGIITLSEQINTSNVLLPVSIGNFALFDNTSGQIKDGGLKPADTIGQFVVNCSGGVTSGNVPSFSNVNGAIADSGIAPANIVKTNATNTMQSGSSIILSKVNGTESGGTVTVNGVSGVITTSSLTTAGGSNYSILWTNSNISSTSTILYTYAGGTNTNVGIVIKASSGTGVGGIVIYNISGSALNGTIAINYLVV